MVNPAVRQEQIEGIDNDEDTSLGDYPIDTLLIRNETRTVHDVLRRIDKGSYIMDPDFQRDFIWNDEKQSKLIESVLMRIPLPVFYLAENSQGQMVVVDGLQRLSTFHRFVNNKLSLSLPHQPELNKKNFEDLSAKLQNRIEDCNLILYLIDAKVPQRALLDIFERVNSGIPLTRQQMRNCLFMGKSTSFLKKEATTDLFKKATGKSLDPKTMRDREFVNRFCAFQILGNHEYKGDMDDFLGNVLERMNEFSEDQLESLSLDFRRGLKNNLIVFGSHAFRKNGPNKEKRSLINASLWDVFSTGLCRYPEELVINRKEILLERFFDLTMDKDFMESITLGTNSTKRVNYRFQSVAVMLKEVFS